MYEDLKFYINLNVKNTPRSYTGKIISDSNVNQLQLDRICSTFPQDEQEAFKYSKLDCITCHGNNGKKYSFYNLSWTGTQTSFGQTNSIVKFTLDFEELIENPTGDQLYNGISFSFDFIDKIFGQASFDTQFPSEDNNNEIKLSLTVPEDLIVKLKDDTIVKFYTEFNGLVSSYYLFDLDIRQNKRVVISFPNRINVEEMYKRIEILKLYFEYVYNYRMNFSNVHLMDEQEKYNLSKVVVSELYTFQTNNNNQFKNRYSGKINELVERIKLWFELYDKFNESLLIWKKTIYNQNVDQNDKYLWICQAFESFCQHDYDINLKVLKNAKKKNNKASYPNLSDYLVIVEDIIEFKFSSRAKYYKNIVKVRDKLTHNNPNKVITDIEKDESSRLIEYFYLSLVVSKLDGISIGRMISLP